MPPRFSPRDYVDPPAAFPDRGVVGVWVIPTDQTSAAQVLVAHYLSEVCMSVIEVLADRGWTRGDLAEGIGESPAVIRRKLNGEYSASQPPSVPSWERSCILSRMQPGA